MAGKGGKRRKRSNAENMQKLMLRKAGRTISRVRKQRSPGSLKVDKVKELTEAGKLIRKTKCDMSSELVESTIVGTKRKRGRPKKKLNESAESQLGDGDSLEDGGILEDDGSQDLDLDTSFVRLSRTVHGLDEFDELGGIIYIFYDKPYSFYILF